jgi:hypothetical protein
MVHNMIHLYGEKVLALRPTPKLGTTPCRLYAAAYSIYSQSSILEVVQPFATWGRAIPWWQVLTYHGWMCLGMTKSPSAGICVRLHPARILVPIRSGTFGFHKNAGNFLTSWKDWLASQEGLCCMEFTDCSTPALYIKELWNNDAPSAGWKNICLTTRSNKALGILHLWSLKLWLCNPERCLRAVLYRTPYQIWGFVCSFITYMKKIWILPIPRVEHAVAQFIEALC